MFGALLKAIFLPKSARQMLAAREPIGPQMTPRPAPRRAAGGSGGGREKIMKAAIKVYRQQRDVYESLDEETRRQIEADAAKLFGDLSKRQR